jgi:hypothetical protein
MAEKLDLAGVAALLKSDEDTIQDLFDAGRLHGVRDGEAWTTTRELLQSDLEMLTEAARIDRLRAGIVPEPVGLDHPHDWVTLEWVDAALERLRT